MRISQLVPVTLLLAALAVPAQGQHSGDGYLFGTPDVRLSLRAGYSLASAHSDVFDDAVKFLTLQRRSFSGPSIGGDVSIRLAPRLDLSFRAGYSAATQDSEDRGFLENGAPIVQTTSFRRAPLTVNAIYYLAPRGRSVGTLAWIPAKVVPWIGGGGGMAWYRFRQEGDFVDYTNLNIRTLTIETSGWASTVQAIAGVDVTLTPRFGLTMEANQLWGSAKPTGGFSSYDKVDLSGITGSFGFTVRL
jgi:hypothetical protein